MPPRKPATTSPTTGQEVGAIRHADKRLNIPTADAHAHDLVTEDVERPVPVAYQRPVPLAERATRDSALDPQLVWKGKDEQDSVALEIAAPPIYIQEKLEPQYLIEDLRAVTAGRRGNSYDQPDLFADFDGLNNDGFESVEFYQHPANWSNRMILGDSLQVMASLSAREDLRGKIQMIYLDPPYGIRFNSNWQVSTASRDVKDGKLDDATREIEQIKAFRDTWQWGIHSYLAYLRDRLVVARDLLTESGSIFLQIGDENVHLVRSLLDEVFGGQNFVSQIAFAKTSSATAEYLPTVADYIVWYAKDRDHLRYHNMYLTKSFGSAGAGEYVYIELPDGRRESNRSGEFEPSAGRPFRLDNMTSPRVREARTGYYPVELEGRSFLPQAGEWKTHRAGMDRLILANRVAARRNSLGYVRYLDDFPAVAISSLWTDTVVAGRPGDKIYVVQTSPKVVERCMLMATDPGDLVLDPTCGSGTTAIVAEQWGRRWITIDTSRVAITLARQRIMAAKLPYYLLADSPDGREKEAELTGLPPATSRGRGDIRQGFVYQRVPHVTLKSIANNPDIKEGMCREDIDAAIARHAESELLYDRPYEDKKKTRVAGPFTVESLSPYRSLVPANDDQRPRSEREGAQAAEAESFETTVLENLRTAGVQNGVKQERLQFDTLERHGGDYIQAVGTRAGAVNGTPERIAVAIGPQYGTVTADLVRRAAREALRGQGHDLLLMLGFAFDSQVVETAAEFRPDEDAFAVTGRLRQIGKIEVQSVRMNPDLAMGNELLKKTRAANLFTIFGEPDITWERTGDGSVVVELHGIDVYDPTSGQIRSSDSSRIALWMIDTDYTGDAFFVRHCYFTGARDPYERLAKALKADIDQAAWESLNSTRSRPFPLPSTGQIAIKVINNYGDEALKVIDL
ncbi:DNA methylase [Frankia canadensis]|uniref:DNA methylase n=1 Tax=Frankia canadensis TaxID=1836972 RepID=A0A2I2KZ95_9ACTN|nr:site-specific DNA-methyltransferase [Frankia canadensis]SNQ50992.1 DNA methylase [Frankia canadensis]SOU58282.1 DNA methylase [Frankia canadensis]